MFVQRWSVRLADEAWGAPSALAVSGDVLPCLPRSRRPEPQPARARATARRRPAPATMLVGLQLDSMAGRTPDSHAGRRSSCATAHAVCRSSSSPASVVRRKASSRSVKANNRAFWITEPRHSQEGDHGHGTEATGRDQGGLGAGGLRRWGRSLRTTPGSARPTPASQSSIRGPGARSGRACSSTSPRSRCRAQPVPR
jgi:hypothetical protein